MSFWKKLRPAAKTAERVSARPRVFVPESVLATTENLIASTHEHEEVVYWAGLEGPHGLVALAALAPAADTSFGSFDTTAASNAVIIQWAASRGLGIVAQLHCHPDHRVGHSRGDDLGALMPYENFLSIVVPHYGTRGIGDFQTSGVHRYEHGSFRRLTRDEVTSTIVIVPPTANFRGA